MRTVLEDLHEVPPPLLGSGESEGTNLGVVGQHVIPQNGRPGIWHLTDVGNHHHWQGVGLWSKWEMSRLGVEGREVEGLHGFKNLFTSVSPGSE